MSVNKFQKKLVHLNIVEQLYDMVTTYSSLINTHLYITKCFEKFVFCLLFI
jgi:hypothetical protein